MRVSLPQGQIIFAPMEGITKEPYRQVINKLYPHWDYVACDFLRIPSVGKYPQKHLIKHIGPETLSSQEKEKTIYQVLTSEKAVTQETVEDLNKIGIHWLDLNLGCPSKTVVKRKGGSFLLSEPQILRKIIREIRQSFCGFFTVKIRIGFEDDSLFQNNLKLFEEEGVNAITVHGRTRAQLYKGTASWDHIKQAVETVNIPIIANGDLWNRRDIQKCFEHTNCHSVMIARGALKTPWLAELYKKDFDLCEEETIDKIKKYFENLQQAYQDKGLSDTKIHKKFKELSRYIFDDLTDGTQIKRQILLSKTLNQCTDHIFML